MFKLFSVLIFLVAFTSTAFAGGGSSTVGDGGHGALCKEDGLKAELLEFKEVRVLLGVAPSLGPASTYSASDYAYYQNAMDAVARLNETLGAQHPLSRMMQISIPLIMNTKTILSHDLLGPTSDMGSTVVRKVPNCGFWQLARYHPETRTITIARTLWYMLPVLSQSGLMVHEALHGWFVGAKTNRVIRQTLFFLAAPLDFRIENETAFVRLVNEKREQIFSSKGQAIWIPDEEMTPTNPNDKAPDSL